MKLFLFFLLLISLSSTYANFTGTWSGFFKREIKSEKINIVEHCGIIDFTIFQTEKYLVVSNVLVWCGPFFGGDWYYYIKDGVTLNIVGNDLYFNGQKIGIIKKDRLQYNLSNKSQSSGFDLAIEDGNIFLEFKDTFNKNKSSEIFYHTVFKEIKVQ